MSKPQKSTKAPQERILLISRIHQTFSTFFADHGIHDFRQEIEVCLARMFVLAQKKSSTELCFDDHESVEDLCSTKSPPKSTFIVCYDVSYIQDILSFMDWRGCCTNYNATVSRSNRGNILPNTALQELLFVLQGKCISSIQSVGISLHSAVRAAVIPIILTLTKVVTSTGVYNSPSGILLRETISAIITRTPAVPFVKPIVEVLESRLKILSVSLIQNESSRMNALRKSLENFNFDEAQQALELSIWLCTKQFVNQGFGPSTASLLATTFSDLCLFSFLPSTKCDVSLADMPKQKPVINGKNKRISPMTIRHLSEQHEISETTPGSENNSSIVVQLRNKNQIELEKVQLREDMERRKRQTLQSIGRAETGKHPLSKKEKFVRFRESILESLLKILHYVNLHCSLESKHALTLRAVISVACQRPRCPGVSICALEAASVRTVDNGMLLVMQHIWGFFVSNIAKVDHLRRYSDYIVNCRHFDDPDQCWEVIDPVISLTFRIATTYQDGQASPGLIKTFRILGRTIFYILVYRRHVLSQKNFESRLTSLLAKLSLHFGDSIELLMWGMNAEEKIWSMEMFCATGITSFVDANAFNEDRLDNTSPDNAEQWPFPPSLCIRSSFESLAPNLASSLLSVVSDLPKNRQMCHIPREVSPCPSHLNSIAVSFMEMLNQDVVTKLFTFFGYKRIVKLGEVCKEWHLIGKKETLWRQLYARRWPNAVNLNSVAKVGPQGPSWRALFIRKWKVERSIRSKFSSNGWKHITCRYVGCISVLRSQQQLEKHNQKHKEASTKRQRLSEKQDKPVTKAQKSK